MMNSNKQQEAKKKIAFWDFNKLNATTRTNWIGKGLFNDLHSFNFALSRRSYTHFLIFPCSLLFFGFFFSFLHIVFLGRGGEKGGVLVSYLTC